MVAIIAAETKKGRRNARRPSSFSLCYSVTPWRLRRPPAPQGPSGDVVVAGPAVAVAVEVDAGAGGDAAGADRHRVPAGRERAADQAVEAPRGHIPLAVVRHVHVVGVDGLAVVA